MLFRRSLAIDKRERQFKTNRMRDRDVFYDINVRGGDPEEVRTFISELMHEAGFVPDINELVQFEDNELEKVLRGGRLKPIKSLIRGKKTVTSGTKYGLLWKFLAFLGTLSLLIYFADGLINYQLTNQNMFVYSAAVLLILAILVKSVKERVGLSMWVKIVGLYNVQDESSDVRIILSAEAKKGGENVQNTLKGQIVEIYDVIANKYARRAAATVKKVIIKKKDETADISLMKAIREVDKDLEKLESQLVSGDIKEDTYKELKEKLYKKQQKLETLLDLVS